MSGPSPRTTRARPPRPPRPRAAIAANRLRSTLSATVPVTSTSSTAGANSASPRRPSASELPVMSENQLPENRGEQGDHGRRAEHGRKECNHRSGVPVLHRRKLSPTRTRAYGSSQLLHSSGAPAPPTRVVGGVVGHELIVLGVAFLLAGLTGARARGVRAHARRDQPDPGQSLDNLAKLIPRRVVPHREPVPTA